MVYARVFQLTVLLQLLMYFPVCFISLATRRFILGVIGLESVLFTGMILNYYEWKVSQKQMIV